MANWTPESWVGVQFAVQAQHLPPPPGVRPPSIWGTEQRLRELFADRIASLTVRERFCPFCYPSTQWLFDLFRESFGPVATVWAALGDRERESFRQDWLSLAGRHNTASDGTCMVESAYLEVVAEKA